MATTYEKKQRPEYWSDISSNATIFKLLQSFIHSFILAKSSKQTAKRNKNKCKKNKIKIQIYLKYTHN